VGCEANDEWAGHGIDHCTMSWRGLERGSREEGGDGTKGVGGGVRDRLHPLHDPIAFSPPFGSSTSHGRVTTSSAILCCRTTPSRHTTVMMMCPKAAYLSIPSVQKNSPDGYVMVHEDKIVTPGRSNPKRGKRINGPTDDMSILNIKSPDFLASMLILCIFF
jgi:hypothetical protein